MWPYYGSFFRLMVRLFAASAILLCDYLRCDPSVRPHLENPRSTVSLFFLLIRVSRLYAASDRVNECGPTSSNGHTAVSPCHFEIRRCVAIDRYPFANAHTALALLADLRRGTYNALPVLVVFADRLHKQSLM